MVRGGRLGLLSVRPSESRSPRGRNHQLLHLDGRSHERERPRGGGNLLTPENRSALKRSDLALALLALALLVLLWALRRVATLVAFALLLAYMLDPIVSQLEQLPFPGGRRLPRAVSAFLVIGVGAALIGWLAVIAAPLLVAQLGGFLERLPQLIETQISHLRVRAALSGSIGLSQLAEELQTNVRAVLPQVAGFLF